MSKKKEKNVLVSVGLPPEIKKQLEKKAAEDDRPLAQYLRSIILKHA